MSNVLALNGEIAPAPTVGVLQRGVLRRPVELTGEDRSQLPMIGAAVHDRVTRVPPRVMAVRNCTRDEGGPFGFGNQVLISSHRKLLRLNAVVVSVAETPGR